MGEVQDAKPKKSVNWKAQQSTMKKISYSEVRTKHAWEIKHQSRNSKKSETTQNQTFSKSKLFRNSPGKLGPRTIVSHWERRISKLQRMSIWMPQVPRIRTKHLNIQKCRSWKNQNRKNIHESANLKAQKSKDLGIKQSPV